ncbi:IS3 family transposase [Lactococcus garvieae]|uniref:IS3 family transposase n=1 Tax=Lactococcus garvieae TaxID=1363 RepID=UPI0038537F4E
MVRRKFDKQFKNSAVKLILEEGYSVKEVSQELDVHANSLYRWVQEVEEYGNNAFPGNGTALSDAQHKIKLLEKENRYLQEELELPKKVPGLLEAKPVKRFEFLLKHHDKIKIKHAVKILKVSRSGFYEYMHRRPSKRQMEREVLSERIKAVFHEHKGRYGAVRITRVLHEQGTLTNTKRVGKLMHLMGLYAKGSCYKYKHYNRKGPSLSRANLINQTFKATAPNKVWLGDMTYIPTKEGTLYLAVNIDVFSRKIVGWSMSSRMQDKLVIDCLLQASGKEQPQADLIVHTDQGSQYTSSRYQSTLRQIGARSSMSRKGNPYDNAMMESFYKTLKRELINDAHFETRAEATQEIFKYIETYYNTKRMHSALDYKSPRDFEKYNY